MITASQKPINEIIELVAPYKKVLILGCGPCGGSQKDLCEIDPDTQCAWHLIIERLTTLGQLDNLKTYIPPKNWNTSLSGGPRKLIREDHII